MTALRSAPALPAGTPPELLLRDLTVGYRDKPVITGLTLSGLQAGHVTALVGPNGAGKSTLLGGLAGLVRASGQVLLDGVDLFRMRPAQRADHFGFMPQAIPQGTALTVLETVISALMASGCLLYTSPSPRD